MSHHPARRRSMGLGLLLATMGMRARSAATLVSAAAPGLPPRPPRSRGAREFIAAVAGLSDHERDLAIRGELLAGNLPDFLRRVWPLQLNLRGNDGRHWQLTLYALPDYLGLGSDEDFLLVPMGLKTALMVATRFGCALPTRRLVDLIYRGSSVRLQPQPLPASEQMRSTAYLLRHDALVEQQRAALGASPGQATAGHKKDLVLSERLWTQPGRVAIYGWHRSDGRAIQPLSTVHGAQYADYSHGVRLVSQTAYLNGHPISIFDLLADPELAILISDEGPLPQAAALARAAADA